MQLILFYCSSELYYNLQHEHQMNLLSNQIATDTICPDRFIFTLE